MNSLKSLQFMAFGLLLLNSSMLFAQAKNIQQISNDVSVLQQGLGKVEQDMNKLRRLLDNRAMLELFQRMDGLEDEVSNLRGMLEQQTHDLAGLKKRQRELYLDTDRRLRELEITSSRAPNPVTASEPELTAPITPVVPELPVAAPVLPVVSVPDTTPAVADKPASISTSTKPSVPVSDERAAYQKAFDMLKEGRYKMANAAFLEFVGKYPDSNYAGNSQYWLGESNYVTRQFEQSLLEFQKVIKQYPNSNKVPDAMLKLGYTYYELRNFDAAKEILSKLRKTYPKSTAARLAGKRLDRMHKEGY